MATEQKTIYRVLRPLQHNKTLFNAKDGIELTDAEAGHLLTTSAIELPAPTEALIVRNAADDAGDLDLGKLTKPQLVAHAAEVHSLELNVNAPKPDLIAAIEEAKAAA